MSDAMQQDAIDCATSALERYTSEKDIANYIKREFDQKYNPTWHCIVGNCYGWHVSNNIVAPESTVHRTYFYIGDFAFLLWTSG
jgi:dynein light chain LC8-type